MSVWDTPFKRGFATCFTICAAIAGVAVYFNDKILDLKNTDIARLEKAASQHDDVTEKLHKEQVLRRQAEVHESELEAQLQNLIAEKWEEKYESERLSRKSLEEQLALLEVRNKDLRKSIESSESVDPKKALEIEYLREELDLAKRELSQLRDLYTKERAKPPVVVRVPVTQPEDDKAVFEMVLASIPNLVSSDTRSFLISTYKGSDRSITISQLAMTAPAMTSTDILKTIQEISPNILNDGKSDTLRKLVNEMTSTDSTAALKLLMGAKQTSQPSH